MALDTEKYKKMLEEECKKVVSRLQDVGRINPDNPQDWEPTQKEMNVALSDENERADLYEEYETDSAILKELEIQFNDIKRALKKIEKGTFGTCEVGGEPINERRLEVNPAARTCIEHQHDLEK